MRIGIHLGGRRVALVVIAGGVLAAAGVAYATIPDAAGVYTACKLNATGTIRLIDPSLSKDSLLSHCTSFESQITWNQKGQAGAAGTSPTVAQLQPGDSHCATGGAAIMDASGGAAYVCSGQNGAAGKDGTPFSGTFTSPNGQFSLTVSDGGVQIIGPDSTISMPSAGGVVVNATQITTVANDVTTTVRHDRRATIDNNDTVRVGANRDERVSGGDTLLVGGGRTETIGGNWSETAAGSYTQSAGGVWSVTGGLVELNGASQCRPAARAGDHVDTTAGVISAGSATVCIGG